MASPLHSAGGLGGARLPMKQFLLFTLSALALTACQKETSYTASEPLSRGRGILNGTPITSSEFPSVGLVKGPDFICTGTLISSDVVLTAEHCVSDSRDQLVSLKFTLDAKYSNTTNTWINVTSVKRYSTQDIAILKLASPINTVEPSEIALTAVTQNEINRLVEIVGYGDSTTQFSGGKTVDSGSGTKRKGVSQMFKFDDNQYTLVSRPSTSRQVICPGDSGGPLYFSWNGRRQLYGVASEVLWRGYCNTVSETYHKHIAYGNSRTWMLNNLASWAKKVSIFQGVDGRGNYYFTRTQGEGAPATTYPNGSTPAFRLLDVPANFSNATCTSPLLRCRNSRGMNYLSVSTCGTGTYEKLLGYACNGNGTSQSPVGAFDLWRVDNSRTGASLSTSRSQADSLVRTNRDWRLVGFHGVHVLAN